MEQNKIRLVLAALFVPATVFAGNCGGGHGGGVGNPHCGHASVLPITQLSGTQAPTTTQPPTQIGNITPDTHNTVLTQKPEEQTVTATALPPPVISVPVIPSGPVKKPPNQTVIFQYKPLLVPPKPPAQQPPVQVVSVPTVSKPPVVVTAQPQVPTTTYNPPQPLATAQPTVTQQIQPLAQPTLPPTQQPPVQVVSVPTVSKPPSHGNALYVHVPSTNKVVTSGRVEPSAAYTLEFIEPGLQSRKVKVYRSNDAAEYVYRDTIPLDQGGFQLIVVGTRNPDYTH